MRLEIREADLEDSAHAAGVVDVLNSYAADPIGGGVPLTGEARERLIPALQSHPGALVLLAFAAGQPVGLAIGFWGLSTFQARPLLNIHDLAVIPELRGRRVGSALLAEVERRARERGCCKLTLEVQDDNSRARSVYTKFGFKDFVVGDSGPTRFLTKELS